MCKRTLAIAALLTLSISATAQDDTVPVWSGRIEVGGDSQEFACMFKVQ